MRERVWKEGVDGVSNVFLLIPLRNDALAVHDLACVEMGRGICRGCVCIWGYEKTLFEFCVRVPSLFVKRVGVCEEMEDAAARAREKRDMGDLLFVACLVMRYGVGWMTWLNIYELDPVDDIDISLRLRIGSERMKQFGSC